MQVETVKAQSREAKGKRTVARLRKTGMIPGIVYGRGQSPEAIALDRHDLEGLLAHGTHIANVEVGGKTQACLLKDVQYDHLGSTPVHVDFTRVDLNERVRVRVPLELRGHAKGVTEGGSISQQLIDLEVECLPLAIPDSIRVNIANVGLTDIVKVRDIEMPEGVTSVQDPETIVVTCREILVPVEPAPGTAPVEAGAAEPEVIAKGKIEKEGEGEAAAAGEKKPAAGAEKKAEKEKK